MEIEDVKYMVFTPRKSDNAVGIDLNMYRDALGKVLLEPDGYSRMYHLEFPDGKRIAAWADEVSPADV